MQAIAKDDRSYSKDLFEMAVKILKKIALKGEYESGNIDKIDNIGKIVERSKQLSLLQHCCHK